jgi:eukaryotic-like serine/threonine-protein kinase
LDFITIKQGRYRILEKIGKGGQAIVYKAEDASFPGRLVALKVILFQNRAIESIYTEPFYQRFRREFMLTSKLKHPQIAFVYDYGIDMPNQIIFMARAYLDGCTLTELLNKQGHFTIKDGIELILSIAQVLDFIHQRGVVHCDLKPSNIFIENGEPILIDFGLASGKDPFQLSKTTAGGTFGYIPPEVFEKNAPEKYLFGPTRDWWGLGCIAFDIFTGRRLFRTSDPDILENELEAGLEQETIKKVLATHPILPLILGLLERNPEKRIKSESEIRKVLEKCGLNRN